MSIKQFRLDRKSAGAQALIGLWGPGSPSGATWFDRSGRGNHGTLTDMDPGTDWVVDSERDWALDFVTNDSVQVSNFLATGDYSITAWVWADTFAAIAGNADALIDNSTAAGSGFRFWVLNSAGSRRLKLQNNYLFGSAGAIGTTEVPTGQWVFVAGTSRNTGATSTCKVYVNGIWEATNAAADDYVQNGSNIAFGYRPTGSVSSVTAHDGKLTAIRIYNRILSDGQINHVYRSTLVKPYADIALGRIRRFGRHHWGHVRRVKP